MKKVLTICTTTAVVALLYRLLPLITNIPLAICVGVVLGIPLSSLHKSFVHQFLGHAKTKIREFWRRHPRLFLPLIEGFFLHHVVHHGKTYRDGYLVQFGERLDMNAVDTWAPEAFYRLFDAEDQGWVRRRLPPKTVIEHLHAADYGLGAVSGFKFASTVLPLVAVIFVLAPFWVAVGAALPLLFVYPAMSNSIHRNIMHINQDGGHERGKHWLTSWLVGTAYMKALERWHWMHHEYIYCNYNLLVLGDFLRGARRRPSQEDLEKMASEGLAMETWFTSLRKRVVRGLKI